MKRSMLKVAVLAIGIMACGKTQEPSGGHTETPKQEGPAVTDKHEALPEPGDTLPEEPAATPETAASTDEAVEPVLVEMFNAAADLSRQGEHAQSLEKYDALLALQKTEKLIAAPRFIASAQMQRAYTLMDLKRLEDAAAALEAISPYIFHDAQRYDYHFSLGNVYGALRKPRKMFSSMVSAISTAEDMDDFSDRPQTCWKKILAFALASEDWAYLIEVADKAEQVAGVRNFPELAIVAQVARQHAQEKQGK